MCEVEKADVVEELLKRGAQCRAYNALGKTALHMAARNGYITSARHIIQMFPNIDHQDASGETPLHTAIRCTQVGMTRLLLSSGASIGTMDMDGVPQLGRCLQIRLELNQLGAWKMRDALRQQLATMQEKSERSANSWAAVHV